MTTALLIFALTYLAIGIQRLPGLHVDRPSGALLGAVAMVAFGVLTFEEALVTSVAGPIGEAGPDVLARIGAAVTLLSQAVSNVPAVLLFTPAVEALPVGAAEKAWLGLAAFSTLAGNLTLIGSVANVIVFECARREGIEVSFSTYLKAGLPVTAITLAIAWAWISYA